MSCKCCDGYCPKCVETPNKPCCGVRAPIIDYKCVNPPPLNRSVEIIGNSYGCDLFKVCPLPDGLLEADQVAPLKAMLQSMLSYFHGYSVLNTGNCADDRIMMGRDEDCTASWMGGVYPGPETACSPKEGTPLEGGCEPCGDEDQAVYRARWTSTIPNECCQIPVVDENGEPVVDEDGEPVTEAARLMFGAVPASHPYLTEYGGTPNMPIDFDNIPPATSNKIANLIKKAICEIEKAAA